MTAGKINYKLTINACFLGYIVQAVVNNFVPLLFLHFQSEFDIPLSQITLLITFNFGIQLLVDLLSSGFVDRIGYRASMLLANLTAAAGLSLLTVLPGLLPNAFSGILISVMIYAVGGGLLEVLVSPIMEACPSENKEAAMSLLHSFYCWGHVLVVAVTTLFFFVVGIDHWRILALLWVILPLIDFFIFTRCPIGSLIEEGERGLSMKDLAKNRLFWILMLMMLCAGASEQAVSQWASTFAEQGLGVSKTLGDLMGPMLFAALMGLSRLIYGKAGAALDLRRFLSWSALLCIAGYLIIILVPNPLLSLIGCGLTGFAVGIFWPGTFSIGAGALKGGGTLLFAMFALAGDIGCMSGPTIAGAAASLAGENLKVGIGAALCFPILMLIGILAEQNSLKKRTGEAGYK